MIKLFEESGKIDGLNLKLNSTGKKFYSVIINKLVFNVFDYFPSFLQLKKNEIEIGDEVTVFFSKSEYKHNGKDTMSRHLKRFVKGIPEQPKKPEFKEEKPIVEKININEEVEEEKPKIINRIVPKGTKTITYPEPKGNNERPIGSKPSNVCPRTVEMNHENKPGSNKVISRDSLIIRQSSFRSAVEFFRGKEDVSDERLFELSEKIEKWVMR